LSVEATTQHAHNGPGQAQPFRRGRQGIAEVSLPALYSGPSVLVQLWPPDLTRHVGASVTVPTREKQSDLEAHARAKTPAHVENTYY
jgi:hypothetical protein